MWGRGGADQFLFTSTADFAPAATPDTIGDFSQAQADKISLKSIAPDAVTAGDEAFSFVGSAAFTTDARFQVRATIQAANTLIEIDTDHDQVTDHTILLYGAVTLVVSDFSP